MDATGPIVLIDDDQDDQDLFSESARTFMPDNIIRSFYNGSQALEYLSTTKEKPFIILCDMNMPVMNGLELLENICSSYDLKSKSIPFVFFSTSAEQKSVQRAYDLGVQGFFKKPDSIAELRRILSLTFSFWKDCLHPNHAAYKK